MWHHHQRPVPVALYGIILLIESLAYLLQKSIIALQGPESLLALAVGRDIKGKLSTALYTAAILTAIMSPPLALAMYVAVALMWLVPDRRIERTLH